MALYMCYFILTLQIGTGLRSKIRPIPYSVNGQSNYSSTNIPSGQTYIQITKRDTSRASRHAMLYPTNQPNQYAGSSGSLATQETRDHCNANSGNICAILLGFPNSVLAGSGVTGLVSK